VRLAPLGRLAGAGTSRRNQIVLIGFYLFAAVGAYEVAINIIHDDLTSQLYLLVAVIGGVIVIKILNSWRTGVYFFLAWLLFEDLVRKFLGNNMVIYFTKDVLALVVLISFWTAYRRREVSSFRPPFLVPLLLFFWFGVLQVFNPASPHLAFGFLGLKLYYFYIPLMFVGYSLLQTESSLRRFFFANLILADVIAALGVVQGVLGHTFLNPAIPAAELKELSTLYRTAPISGVVLYRPTSVFVSDGRFGSYMILSMLLAFGFAGYLLLRSRQGRLFAFLSLAIIGVSIMLSGSRGVLMWSAGSILVGSAAFLWGAPWRQGKALRVLRAIQRTALVGGLGLLLFSYINPDALLSRLAFYTETLSPNSPKSELIYRTLDYPWKNFATAFDSSHWLYGYGIGTASLGTQYVWLFFRVASPAGGVENGYGTLILEFGVLGLVLWIAMSAAICRSCWKMARKLKGSPWFPLGFMIFWFAFLLLVPFTFNGMVSYQNFVLNAYLWLLIGVLFRVPDIALATESQVTQYEPDNRGRHPWRV
jgi:O-antigen ligase